MTRGPRHPALQPASYAVGDIVPKGFTGRPLVDEYYDPNAFHVYSGPQNNQPIPRPFTVGVPPHVYPDSMYNAAHSGRVPYPAHYSMPSPSANFDQESVPPVPYHGQQHPMPASRHDGRLHKSPSPPQSLPPNMKPGPHGVISAPSCLPPPGAGYTVSPSPASQRLPLQPLPPERQHLLSPPADTMTPLPSPSLPNPHPEPVAHQHQASYRAPPVPQVPRQPVSNIRHAPPLPEIPLPPRALPHERRPSGQTQNQLLQPRNIPPRPAPHYLPKRLVMPSPLQNRPQQSQPTAAAPRPAAPLYLDKHRPFQPEKKVQFDMHVRAQEIPMHQREPKLVKKRNTIAGAGNNAREERQPEGMHRRGTSWFGGKMTRHATVQEEKGSKFGRKLSKRK
ncbi:hypothetical protein NEOLEDRAFT_1126371 [Neolentinus lepideus HHB14362 ss-1]|uniref:Uncharacterized protein n=1 Tax=Neolentinus lepideus HHB14362 ss-1 TaxID=1314782 RepID=A0A165W6P4_9AGAM|nr:hypothetical protein NEOLEDRAFT_1126371 [Neolentinus lepideus HHB14362 ss-1]